MFKKVKLGLVTATVNNFFISGLPYDATMQDPTSAKFREVAEAFQLELSLLLSTGTERFAIKHVEESNFGGILVSIHVMLLL